VLPDRNVVDEVARRLDAAQIAHEDCLAADPWGNRVRFVSAP
jgi:hypothetical protein